MSIAAVQARMVELQSAITAVSRPVTAQPAHADFGDALATALAGESALAGLPGRAASSPDTGVGAASMAAALGGQSAFPGASAATAAAGIAGTVPGAGLTGLAPIAGLGAGLAPAPGAVAGAPAAGAAAGAVAGTVPGAGNAPVVGARPATTAAEAAPAATGRGAALVESAKKYLGVPYVWGGESLSEGGLDCSGLVQLAMKDIGVDVPRVVRQQMTIGTEVPSLDQALPGDLVVTRGGAHIGIYVGENKWIHAPYPGEKVKLAEMTSTPTTIRRVL